MALRYVLDQELEILEQKPGLDLLYFSLTHGLSILKEDVISREDLTQVSVRAEGS